MTKSGCLLADDNMKLKEPDTPVTGGEGETVLKREIKRLSLLNELAINISLTHNPEEVMDKVLSLLHEVIDVDEAFFIIDHHGEYQRFARDSAPRTTTRAHRQALTELVIKQIRVSQKIETFDIADSSALAAELPLLPLPVLTVAPLEFDDVIFGALVLLGADRLNDDDISFLERLVHQVRGNLFHALTFEEERDYLLLKQDLRIASQIQSQLLPKSAPRIDGYDIFGKTVSSHAVGGDYYDYLRSENDNWVFCIGDATGKGIPAAMIMANLQATMRSLVLSSKPVQVYQRMANNLIYNSTEIKKYASLFLGVLNQRSHTLQYSNAGHNPPLLAGSSGETLRLKTGGSPLGIINSMHYRQDSVYMNQGDILLLYSDGILEALNGEEEELALDEIEAYIRENASKTAAEIGRGILDFALHRSSEGLIRDDMTVVVVKRNYVSSSPSSK